MRVRSFLRALLFVAAAAPAVRAQVLPLPASGPLAAPAVELEAALLRATNAARTAAGLPPVRADEGLARAARAHADEMAALDYFSHGSPVAANATLPGRLANAGSPLLEVAENLALLGEPGGPGAAAERAVQGWLASPGHRTNLLNADYDLVGFGTATGHRGELLVVQDFGAQPTELLAANVVASARTVSRVEVTLRAAHALSAVLGVAGAGGQPRALPAGDTTLTVDLDETGSVQLLAGVALGAGRYVVDDGGWIDTMSGTYRPDPTTPRHSLVIAGARAHRLAQRGARLTLRYRPLEHGELALFLGGEHRPDARVGAARFELFLPDTLGQAEVEVGVVGVAGEVRLLERFHLDTGELFPQLRAGAAP